MPDLQTAYITIGNSDNKLQQHEWAAYCNLVDKLVSDYSTRVYFKGFSLSNSEYQNACFSFSTTEAVMTMIREALKNLAKLFRQDCIALALVDTVEMVTPS